MTAALPADLRDAVVRVCGDAFHYYATLRPVFIAAGVSGDVFDSLRPRCNSKYVLCRTILAELDARGDGGRRVQQAIVRELLAIREPMPDVPDPGKGKQALADLARLAKNARVTTAGDAEPSATSARRKRVELERAAREATAARKAGLQARFTQMTTAAGQRAVQERGYAFEEFLRDLFVLEDLTYRMPYDIELRPSSRSMERSPSMGTSTSWRPSGGAHRHR